MNGEKESREELRARLRRCLIECGVNPDLEDARQLQSDDKLIRACQKRIDEINFHKKEIERLQPNKADLAKAAGLSRTSISESHGPNLNKIYESFFPQKSDKTVPIDKYNEVIEERDKLQKRVDGHAITQAELITLRKNHNLLMSQYNLQAESIKNLVKTIEAMKKQYLEATGEILQIDYSRLLVNKESDDNDRLGIPITSSNISS